jgi:hypothetical protein
MSEGIVHNNGEEPRARSGAEEALVLRSQDLPRVITLELEDGSRKRYCLMFAKTAKGLMLNKAI